MLPETPPLRRLAAMHCDNSRHRRLRESISGSIARSATWITPCCSIARSSGCFTNRGSFRPARRPEWKLHGTGGELLAKPGGKIENGDRGDGGERGAGIFPAARAAKLLKSTVIKEVHATYSPRPGIDQYRPKPETAWPRVFLAGDWIATGWPATMEGAVRSGYLAAEALAKIARGIRRQLSCF